MQFLDQNSLYSFDICFQTYNDRMKQTFGKIAADIVVRYSEVTDQETKAFALDLFHKCKTALKLVEEPLDGNDIITVSRYDMS